MNKTVHELSKTGRYERTAKNATKEAVTAGMSAAVLAVLSQVSIPLPSGIPVTLQTFAVALTGAVLAWKLAMAGTLIYILLGAVGLPVFAGFYGGVQVLAGPTGGFIWGFIVMAMLCGIGVHFKNKAPGVIAGFAGLAVCHLSGIWQFMTVMGEGFPESFFIVSAPYLVKDAISVVLALAVGSRIRTRLLRAGLL